jgi:hypothetical protein
LSYKKRTVRIGKRELKDMGDHDMSAERVEVPAALAVEGNLVICYGEPAGVTMITTSFERNGWVVSRVYTDRGIRRLAHRRGDTYRGVEILDAAPGGVSFEGAGALVWK